MYLIVMLIEFLFLEKIEEIYYKPGKFLNASLDKASEENERNYFKIKSKKIMKKLLLFK